MDSGFIIRVQALILKKNNLRKNLIHQGHPVPVENMEFQTRKEESIHVYTLSKRPGKTLFFKISCFQNHSRLSFFIKKNDFLGNISSAGENADNKSVEMFLHEFAAG